jgi:nucleotide-binding universal stress UspA family protein
MKKILVPTDFSSVANTAAQFAVDMFGKGAATIDLLHVFNIGSSGTQLKNWAKLQSQAMHDADEKADALIKRFKSVATVRYETMSGYPVEKVIKEYTKKARTDLIVMGTHGATGLKKVLFGSNAASVIAQVKVPVLAVPPGSRFEGIRKILYATDMTHLDTEVKKVADFARRFNAFVTVVYINEHADLKRNRHHLAKVLTRMAQYPNLAFTVVRSADVKGQLRKLVGTLKPDLIAMFTHRLALMEKLMGKSVTRDMILDTKVPLLSFNRTR